MVTELVFVVEFWWKVLCGFAGERQKSGEEREMEEKREKLNYLFIYIIRLYNLYYFNELNVKIETMMLGRL